MDDIMGPVYYYFVRATDAIVICTSYQLGAAQLICRADGTAACHASVPGFFFFFPPFSFLAPSRGKFLNSCFKSVKTTKLKTSQV